MPEPRAWTAAAREGGLIPVTDPAILQRLVRSLPPERDGSFLVWVGSNPNQLVVLPQAYLGKDGAPAELPLAFLDPASPELTPGLDSGSPPLKGRRARGRGKKARPPTLAVLRDPARWKGLATGWEGYAAFLAGTSEWAKERPGTGPTASKSAQFARDPRELTF